MKIEHSIELMCRVLKVSRSGFYEWRNRPSLVKVERVELKNQILEAFRISRKTYGHRSIRDELIKAGIPIGRRLTLKLMNEMALVPGAYKRSPYAAIKKASPPKVCEYLLDRNFSPPAQNKVWTGDITYIWTQNGWAYLAVVLDLFARKIIGWSVSDKPDTQLVIAAHNQALDARKYIRGEQIFHSDQGCQYTSSEFCLYQLDRGIVQSMSRRGQCWDNAPTESFLELGMEKQV